MIYKAILSLTVLAALSGCAPMPISSEEADPIPPSRLYSYGAKPEAFLVVTRDSGFVGAGCTIRLYIDGKQAADFNSGETSRFSVGAGKHVLAAKPVGMCGGSGISESEIDIKPGELLKRRMAGMNIMPTTF